MSPQLLTALGIIGSALGVGGVLVAIVNTFLSPKTRAEAKQIARSIAKEELDLALETLRRDVNDARDRATKAEQRADRAEQRADESDQKQDELLAQYRIAIDHLWRLQLWARRYYEAGHPPGMPPPPLADLDELRG